MLPRVFLPTTPSNTIRNDSVDAIGAWPMYLAENEMTVWLCIWSCHGIIFLDLPWSGIFMTLNVYQLLPASPVSPQILTSPDWAPRTKTFKLNKNDCFSNDSLQQIKKTFQHHCQTYESRSEDREVLALSCQWLGTPQTSVEPCLPACEEIFNQFHKQFRPVWACLALFW